MAVPVGESGEIVFETNPLSQRTARTSPEQQTAARNGKLKPFEKLFKSYGGTTDVDPECLLLAAQGGHAQLLQLLFDNGVEFPPDRFGTALDAAVELGFSDVVFQLLSHHEYDSRRLLDLLLKNRSCMDVISAKLKSRDLQAIITQDDLEKAFLSGPAGLKALFDLGVQFKFEEMFVYLQRAATEKSSLKISILLRHMLPVSSGVAEMEGGDPVPPPAPAVQGLVLMDDGGVDHAYPPTARAADSGDVDINGSAAPTPRGGVSPPTAVPVLVQMSGTSPDVPSNQVTLVQKGDRTPFKKLNGSIHPGCVVLAANWGKMKLLTWFLEQWAVPDDIWNQALVAAAENGHVEALRLLVSKHEYLPRVVLNLLIECAVLKRLEVVEALLPQMKKQNPHLHITDLDLAVVSVFGAYPLTVLVNDLGGKFDADVLVRFLQTGVSQNNRILVEFLARKLEPKRLAGLNLKGATVSTIIGLSKAKMPITKPLQHFAAQQGSIEFFEVCSQVNNPIDPACLYTATEGEKYILMDWFLETGIIGTLINREGTGPAELTMDHYKDAYYKALTWAAKQKNKELIDRILAHKIPFPIKGYELDPAVRHSTPEIVSILISHGALVGIHHLASPIDEEDADMLAVLLEGCHGRIQASQLQDHLFAAACNGDDASVEHLIGYGVPIEFRMIREAALRGHFAVTRRLLHHAYSDPNHPISLALRGDLKPRDHKDATTDETLFICAYTGDGVGVHRLIKAGIRVNAASICIAMLRRQDLVAEQLYRTFQEQGAPARPARVEALESAPQARVVTDESGGGPASGSIAVPARGRPRRPSVNGKTEDSDDETQAFLDVPPSVPKAAQMKLPEPPRPGRYSTIGEERRSLIEGTNAVAQLLAAAADQEREKTMGPEWIRDGDPEKGAGLAAAWSQAQNRLGQLMSELRRMQRSVQSKRMPSIKPPFPDDLARLVLAEQNEGIKELPNPFDLGWCFQLIAYFKLESMLDLFSRVLPQLEETKPDDEKSSQGDTSFEAIRIALLRGNVDLAKDLAAASLSTDFATQMIRVPGDEVIAALTRELGSAKPSSDDLYATVAFYPSRAEFLVNLGAPVSPEAVELAVFSGHDDVAEALIKQASSNDRVTLAYQGHEDECISLISSAPFISLDDLRRLLVAAVYSKSQKLVDYLIEKKRIVPSFESIALVALRGDKVLMEALLKVSPNDTIYDLAHHLQISAGMIDRTAGWAHPLLVQRCQKALSPEMSELIRSYVTPRLPQSPSLRRPPKREIVRVDSSMVPLQTAAFRGDVETFARLLTQKQYLPQVLAQCLFGAAQNGHLQILKALIDRGTIPDFEAIDAAIEADQTAAVEMLIKASTSSGEVAVLILRGVHSDALKPLISVIRDDKAKEQCLIAASYMGIAELIEFIVSTHHIPVGSVAIIRAVNQGHGVTALSLIEQAQPLDIVLSAFKGDLNNVKKFCNQKTPPTLDQLQAALFAAVFALSEEVVTYLLDKKTVPVTVEALRMAHRKASGTQLQQKLQTKSTPEVIAQFASASSLA